MSDQVKLPMTTIIALVMANLFPLWGVFFRDWDVFRLLTLFWAENLIVGGFNILRMPACTSGDRPFAHVDYGRIIFFILHYGLFTLVHGMIVFSIAAEAVAQEVGYDAAPSPGQLVPLAARELWVPFLALTASHALSFIINFIGRGEYRNASVDDMMTRPYGRILVLHVTLIFGAALALLTRQHWLLLAFLAVLKIVLDVRAHIVEREKLGEPG